jgi:hypothetical protein
MTDGALDSRIGVRLMLEIPADTIPMVRIAELPGRDDFETFVRMALHARTRFFRGMNSFMAGSALIHLGHGR